MKFKLKILLITLLTVIHSAAYSIVFTTTQAGGNSSKDLTVQAGKQYQLKFDLQHQSTNAVRVQILEGSNVIVEASNLTDGTHVFSFTPTTQTVTLKFIREDNDNASRDFEVNNLMYEEITQVTQVASNHEIGTKEYELSDHLGNVRVVVSEKKVNGNREVVSAKDYLPFGMIARNYSNGSSIRYGYNGKEKENEVSEGDYDFGARIYSSKLGRWLACDPLTKKYAGFSPYSFAGNSVVVAYDPDGKKIMIYYEKADGTMAAYEYGSAMEVPDDVFVRQVICDLDFLKEDSQSAKDLIERAQRHDKNMNIVHTPVEEGKDASNYTDMNNLTDDINLNNELFENASNCTGTHAVIFYNPDQMFGAMDESGSQLRPSRVGLAEEIFHGLRVMDGEAIIKETNVCMEEGTTAEHEQIIKQFDMAAEEKVANDYVNYIRAEMDPTGQKLGIIEKYVNSDGVATDIVGSSWEEKQKYYSTGSVRNNAGTQAVPLRNADTKIKDKFVNGQEVK